MASASDAPMGAEGYLDVAESSFDRAATVALADDLPLLTRDTTMLANRPIARWA